ncbi:LOW QUALITY PROTEIN: O-acyltransferase like protein-like [Haliotis rubra]|uniref:LOW QUALITY PROTEIN: O-acyltransferase like protein-like n=1 Tax=Haliotis rubra TaxID=36100 RepID=UPI001EE57EFB|nr:LOW QUALITY PROTEIN: O-acyltransferase like protein-like [Haliotis rubra]
MKSNTIQRGEFDEEAENAPVDDNTQGEGNLHQMLGSLQDTRDVCNNHTQNVITGVMENKEWALQMLDAFGKPGSGILKGELKWLGSFDECMGVITNRTEVDFGATYCRALLLPPNQTNPADPTQLAITLGLCMPDSCTGQDVSAIATDLLMSQNISLLASVTCYEKDFPLDTDAIVAIVICSIFGLLVILGTGYDVIFIQMRKGKFVKSSDKSTRAATPVNGRHTVDSEKVPLLSESTSVSIENAEAVQEIGQDRRPDQNTASKPQEQTSERVHGFGIKLLLSFSAYTNGAKLLDTKQAPGSLTAVHGIRFLSMTWVVLGHAFSSVLSMASNLAPFIQESVSRWTFHGILNALVSVDTFFTLSGLLVAYLAMKELKKGRGKLNWAMFYFHRFWRLTPVYMMMLMFYTCLLHYLGDGPVWPQTGLQKQQCRDNWWTNLLYINNLVNRNDMCFSWAWYLANDMQFFILTPLILIPLFYSEMLGMIVIGIFLAATLTTAGLISRLDNLPLASCTTEGNQGLGYFADYYITPYCRMGPYIIGIAAGYLLYKTNCTLRLNKKAVLVGWALAAASALAVLYGPYESANGTPMPSDVSAFYNSAHRTVWGAAVCWVVVACATGNGGFVNTLMSWSGFVTLSRLTYCAYLIHPMVIMYQYMTQRSPFFITDVNIVFNFLGFLVITYGLSFVVSLVFEAPMMGLEKALFKRERRN